MENKNYLEELKWRGLFEACTPGTKEHLQANPVKAYVGFDPSTPSLQLGNLIPIMLLRHLQQAGHQPIAVVGGATGMIGDPGGRLMERQLLDEETLQKNVAGIQVQLEKFLDFDHKKYPALLFNNYDWFKSMGCISFLRDVGKHFPINVMLSKDVVKNRLKTGISFTEFSYQLLQGYDFYYLYTHHGVTLQMAGADQWGNLVAGVELIRRRLGKKAHALTAPLLTKADGSKFGKTAEGALWLDPNQTSPYKLYQFLLNSSDEEAIKLLKIFITSYNKEELDELITEHGQTPEERLIQRKLATEIVTLVHSAQAALQAERASQWLFGKLKENKAIETLDEPTLLSALEGVPRLKVTKDALARTLLEFLTHEQLKGGIFSSRAEARRLIEGGGVQLNHHRIIEVQASMLSYRPLFERYYIVQKGKKQYYLIIVQA